MWTSSNHSCKSQMQVFKHSFPEAEGMTFFVILPKSLKNSIKLFYIYKPAGKPALNDKSLKALRPYHTLLWEHPRGQIGPVKGEWKISVDENNARISPVNCRWSEALHSHSLQDQIPCVTGSKIFAMCFISVLSMSRFESSWLSNWCLNALSPAWYFKINLATAQIMNQNSCWSWKCT